AADRRVDLRGRARHAAVRATRRAHPDRPGPGVRARARRRPRRPRRGLHLGALNDVNTWLTTILIFLPVAGALACFVLPLGRRATAPFALLVSLVEVGFWIESLTRFDFSQGLQFEQRASWFSDLNVSYHVGMYGFSLWLVGLTVVVMTAAIGYAFLVGRERPRAYYGLMLLLAGAV